MIDIILKNHLEGVLDVPVVMEIPKNPAAEYVLIERTGTRMIQKRVEEATLAIQTYSTTLYKAALLQYLVRDAMNAAEELPEIGSVEVTGMYNYSDDATKQYRYQGVYSVINYSV